MLGVSTITSIDAVSFDPGFPASHILRNPAPLECAREEYFVLAEGFEALPRRGAGFVLASGDRWAMDEQLTTALTVTALEMAPRQRPVSAGLLHHSNRGSQYGAVAFQHRLVSRGIRGSMSRPGNC